MPHPFPRALALALVPLLAACATPGRGTSGSGAGSPPNIVVLFADDLGYGDLGSFGHPNIQTPALDGLAAGGIRLTSFYAGNPVCSPSRAALLTGRYPLRVGIPNVLGPSSAQGLPAGEVTLAEALQARGYRTAAVGKWHLGHLPRYLPTRHGFDRYFGVPYSNDMMRPWVAEDRPVPLMRDTVVIEPEIVQEQLTERQTQEAVSFIRESRGQPFFLYLAYSMPHLPIAASAPFRGRSRAGPYGDVIEELDASVGRVLATLEEIGAEDNTIVVFTSDNGPWLELPDRMIAGGVERWHAGSPGPLRGSKGTSYEGGVRVPGIIRWPGVVRPGRVSAELVTALDLFPTLVAAAGGAVPADRPIDGRDLRPLLAGGDRTPSEEYFYFIGRQLQGVRQGEWKLRLGPVVGREATGRPDPQLFNLELDPAERYDVAAQHPQLVARMTARMASFAAEVGGVVPQ